MMKSLSLLAVLAATALAIGTGGKPGPKTIHCAVMTASTVDIANATKTKMFADYKGRRYFFCCGGCPEAFKKNPAKYAKSESIATPKAPVVKKTKKPKKP